MDAVLRGLGVYVVLWLILRLTGRRTMSEITTFDFILLLICGEATQQALLGEDFTVTNAGIVILTIVMLDDALTMLRARFPGFERVMDSIPVLIMKDGKPLADRLRRERIDQDDILHAARESHGIERLDAVNAAVLEPSGGISVIPRKPNE
jgi:uncharacterized membrane protein YcaP (DUF421 family)